MSVIFSLQRSGDSMPLTVKLRSRWRGQNSPTHAAVASNYVKASKTSNAIKCAKYRENLKRKGSHSLQKEVKAQYMRTYRANLSADIRALSNAGARERMQKYRARRKQHQKEKEQAEESNKNVNKQKTRLTRCDSTKLEEQRRKWKDSKRLYRASLSSQKKRRINEKRRRKYGAKHKAPTVTVPKQKTPGTCPKAPGGSGIKRKRSKRGNTGTAAKRLCFNITGEMSEQNRRKLEAVKRKSLNSVRSAGRGMGVSWRLIVKKLRRKRSDAIPDMVEKQIHDIYQKNARIFPDKKSARMNTDLEPEPRGILERTLLSLHKEFCSEHPEIKVCFSTFCSLKPKNLLASTHHSIRACLCEVCTNVRLKVEALDNVAQIQGVPAAKIGDVYRAADLSMCQKAGAKFHKRKCIERTCMDCGIGALHQHLEELEPHRTLLVSWVRWELAPVQLKKKADDKEAPPVMRKKDVLKTGTVADLTNEFEREVGPLSEHLHTATWQNNQYSSLKADLPIGHVLMVLDFAENYACLTQDEVQSGHWHHEQATLHPIVSTYHCKQCDGSVTEYLDFITPDNTHDYHAVHHFLTVSNEHLVSVRSLAIEHEVQFTDGCAAQYKSFGPFSDVSLAEEDFGFQVTRCFFGSGHGKGPSDGESAVVKRSASAAVKAGKAKIGDAKELYEYSKTTLTKQPNNDDADCQCVHVLRTFFYVAPGDIKRDRAERTGKTIPGTRKLHSVRSSCDDLNRLQVRNLACFCQPCRQLVDFDCRNADHVDPWEWKQVRAGKRKLQVFLSIFP